MSIRLTPALPPLKKSAWSWPNSRTTLALRAVSQTLLANALKENNTEDAATLMGNVIHSKAHRHIFLFEFSLLQLEQEPAYDEGFVIGRGREYGGRERRGVGGV